MEWYAIQTYSGSEKSVGEAIRNLIVQNQMQDRFGEVVVPTESIIETKRRSWIEVCIPDMCLSKLIWILNFGI